MGTMRTLITGASGSGTTTLAHALAGELGATAFHADDYFWMPTSPPFTTKRDPEERLAMFLRDLAQVETAVISGSIVAWGGQLEDSISLIVFLTVPAAIRVERLHRREQALLGRVDPAFIEWAAQYDEGRLPGRSRQKHERWLAQRNVPIVRIDGEVSLDHSRSIVLTALKQRS